MNVGEMQRKLSLWAEQDKELKFFDLYHLIYDQDWLRLAHDYVAQNAGSKTAGCDGINMSFFDEKLEENLQQLTKELKAETFEPSPVRRVYLLKSNGKFRPLGIPSIKDRIVQEAVRMILEPIYEADFSLYSFGFRPNRRTMDAIKCITWSTQEEKKFFWTVEGDISSYFDTINHRKLIKIIRRRIRDKKLIRLIWKFLRAGVMEEKLFKDTKLGTPQGGIVSPILANIYLNELDRYLLRYTGLSKMEKTYRRRQGQGNVIYIRYADDFVALVNGTREMAEALKEELYTFLKEQLRLTLSKEKTKITHLNDGFRFLGFWIQRCMGGKGITTKVLIPKVAIEKFRNKIADATDPTTDQDSVNAKILALNRIIKGSTLATADYRLTSPDEFKSKRYQERFLKPNPYTTQEIRLDREELPSETYWNGYEVRPGMTDLRPIVLERDGYLCQICGRSINLHTAHIDHIKPFRRFKRPVDANFPDNLWALCEQCHRKKTEFDRQMESRMR